MVEIGGAFAIAALDLHAGDALQRFGGVGVGQLADVLRLYRVDDLVGIALDRLRRADALAHAGDDDIGWTIRLAGSGLRSLLSRCRCAETHRGHGYD